MLRLIKCVLCSKKNTPKRRTRGPKWGSSACLFKSGFLRFCFVYSTACVLLKERINGASHRDDRKEGSICGVQLEVAGTVVWDD